MLRVIGAEALPQLRSVQVLGNFGYASMQHELLHAEPLAQALAGAPWLSRLQAVTLGQGTHPAPLKVLSGALVPALAACGGSTCLELLNLNTGDGCTCAWDDIRALAAAPLPALRSLVVVTRSFPRNMGHLLSLGAPLPAWAPSLRELMLDFTRLGFADPTTAQALATAPLHALTRLELAHWAPTDGCLQELMQAPWAGDLLDLSLRSCSLPSDVVWVLAAGPLASLERLDLTGCNLGWAGVACLAGAAFLPTLWELVLDGNPWAAAVPAARVRRRPRNAGAPAGATAGAALTKARGPGVRRRGGAGGCALARAAGAALAGRAPAASAARVVGAADSAFWRLDAAGLAGRGGRRGRVFPPRRQVSRGA